MKLKLGPQRKYAIILKGLSTECNRREAVIEIAKQLRIKPSEAAAMVKQAPVRVMEHKRRGKLVPLARVLKKLGAKVLLCEVDDTPAKPAPRVLPEPADCEQAAQLSHESSGDPLEDLLADLKDQNLISPDCEISGDDDAESIKVKNEILPADEEVGGAEADESEFSLKL